MTFESMSMEKRIRHQLEARTKEDLIAARDRYLDNPNQKSSDIIRLINDILVKKYEEKR